MISYLCVKGIALYYKIRLKVRCEISHRLQGVKAKNKRYRAAKVVYFQLQIFLFLEVTIVYFFLVSEGSG